MYFLAGKFEKHGSGIDNLTETGRMKCQCTLSVLVLRQRIVAAGQSQLQLHTVRGPRGIKIFE